MSTALQHHTLRVRDLEIHYVEAGAGEPVLLLHGWPTSSFLWRHIMPDLARHNRVIALDLPGFGKSSKPVDASYNFAYFSKVIDEFLQALGITTLGMAVHDLGGPVGLFWVCANAARVKKLAILNTLVYPEMSWAVKAFILALRLPLVRDFLASPAGLRLAMRIGLSKASRLTPEALAGVTEPFQSANDREALLRAGGGLQPKGFFLISKRLPELRMPVRVIYGENDRILPDITQTVARLQIDLPHAEVTKLEDCGHFLQEERPADVARLLAEFFAK